jgi:hypothetical protein
MRKVISAVAAVFLLLLGLLTVAWLSTTVPPNPDRSKSTTISDVVSSVERDSDTKDIIVRLVRKKKELYYINRGMESEVNSKALDSLILNRPVSIAYYTGGWHPFGKNTGGHICEIIADDKVVYTEFSK